MVNMIVDQRFLGVVDRVLDRLQLLGKLEAGPPLFDHGDDRLKMAFRPPQATDDVGVVLVLHGARSFLRMEWFYPPGRIVKDGIQQPNVAG